MVKDGERKIESESRHVSEVGFGHIFKPEEEDDPARRRAEKITAAAAAGKVDSSMILTEF